MNPRRDEEGLWEPTPGLDIEPSDPFLDDAERSLPSNKHSSWEPNSGLSAEVRNPFLDNALEDSSLDKGPNKRAQSEYSTSYTAHDTYDTWTELQTLPRTDTSKLPRRRVRRSSSFSSTSSDVSLVAKAQVTQCLDSVGICVASCFELPVVRHIFWPFGWLERQRVRMLRDSRLHGWRMGMLFGCCISSTILACNIAVLVIGSMRNGGYRNGFAIPLSGTAADMSWWSSAFHIAINASSTLLLAASNYTMQVLSSPTRGEVDQSHVSRRWLDVGVLSLRNFGRISIGRRMLCIIMGLTSIPVHLFYNSAVFYIAADNAYDIEIVQAGSTLERTYFDLSGQPGANPPSADLANTYKMVYSDDWTNLYDSSIVSFGDVVLVLDLYSSEIDNKTRSGMITEKEMPLIDWNANTSWPIVISGSRGAVQSVTGTQSVSKQWIRLDLAFNNAAREMTGLEVPKFAHVNRTFVRSDLTTSSRIQLSLTFMIIVVVCNAVKLATMVAVILHKRDDYLVTVGDGVASFLERPDPTTERMCVMTKGEIITELTDPYHENLKRKNDRFANIVHESSRMWNVEYGKYSTALNRDRQVGSSFIVAVTGMLLISLIVLLSTMAMLSSKWGTASTTTFRETDSSTGSTLLNAWLANAPQLILSFCYLAINSECTAMAGASEWNNLGKHRKGLRVTRPRGQQRETYFLQLPYRWSLPLTAASGGLHWLLSQSVFIVRIDRYNQAQQIVPGQSQSACGFSAMSFMTLCFAFFIMVGAVGVIGRKKFLVHIPFAASCSLVISAACHPSPGDVDPQARPVKWGVVEEKMFDDEKHCTISSQKVKRPVVGEKYV